MTIRLAAIVLAGVCATAGTVAAQDQGNRFKSYDDFEEMPIHSTLLIDRQGRIHWARHGGAPFDDVTFLQAQLRRMNQRQAGASSTALR